MQSGIPTLTETSISTGGDAPPPPVAMKQPFHPRVTTVPLIRVEGLEVLLLVNTTIIESTTYVVGTGSPSMARGGGGMTGVLLIMLFEGLHSKQPCR